MSVVIFIVILLVLILVHEFGHFFTAKRFGIRVDEFGFGFPPKLFSLKKGETEYTFNLLPLGGFVKIFGENGEDLEARPPLGGLASKSENSSRSFVNKPKWQQAIVLFAGVFANFLLAWLLFSIGFMSGLPTSVGSEPAGAVLSDINLVIISVAPKSPAENAGLKIGDKIISIGENDLVFTVKNTEEVREKIIHSDNKEVLIGYVRGKNEISYIKVKPVSELGGEPKIGISMDQIGTAKLPFFTALAEGMRLTLFMTKNTAMGLYTLIRDSLYGKGSLASITGPVGMVGIVNDAYQFGFVYLLSFAALISINLAIINLIPFPALDGGRLFFLLIEKIKGSRMNPRVVNTVNMIGFGILILLMVVITYHDVVKLL